MSVQTTTFDAAGVQYAIRMTDVDAAQKEAATMSVLAGKTALRSAMRAAMRVLRKGLLAKLPPRRSGKLRRSIRTKIRVEAARSIVTGKLSLGAGGAWYARLLEQGSGMYGTKRRAFVIRAKNKKALRIPGLPHPVRKVTIKGIRPRRMVQRTGQQDMNAARQAFSEAFHGEFRRVTKVWKT